jgi:hypothetical protein
MNVITDMPAAPTGAGVSPEELAVMRQAAARLGAIPAGTGKAGAPDLFGMLAAPFRPAPPGARARWKKEPGLGHWCHP